MSTEIKNIVESMIFASEEEITSKQIKDIVDKSGLRVSVNEIEESVTELNEEYKHNSKPFEILKIAGGFTFATKKEYGRFIGKLFEDKQKKKLSPSALETLSIIAYKQPMTRSEIEFIRGVNVDYIVNSLLEKELITIIGRAETPGRPILYGTTKTFLKVLGLNSLEDLPKLKEINEILKNEEIEGITEADIELFNSVNNPEMYKEPETDHQLELLTAENLNEQSEITNTESNYTTANDEVVNDEVEVVNDEVEVVNDEVEVVNDEVEVVNDEVEVVNDEVEVVNDEVVNDSEANHSKLDNIEQIFTETKKINESESENE